MEQLVYSWFQAKKKALPVTDSRQNYRGSTLEIEKVYGKENLFEKT